MPPTRMALAVQAGAPQPSTAAGIMPAHTGLLGSEPQGPQQSAEAYMVACNSGSEAPVECSGRGAKDSSSSGACDQVEMHSPGVPLHSPAGHASDAPGPQPEAEQPWSTAGTSCLQDASEVSCSALELSGSPVDQSDEDLVRMEARYVHNVYDIIATHFSATRFAIWPKVSTAWQECH